MSVTPNNYLEFNNPIQIIWRSGLPSDPFVDRLDISKVVNQRIALLEIPDELYRVRIANMQEINYERFITDMINPEEYYVDYANGFVYFHHMKEALTMSIVYKGRGVLLYPSSRIVHYDGTNPSENLHNIIQQAKEQVEHLIDETQNYDQVMRNMIIATNITNEATDRAMQATDQALNATQLVHDAYNTTVLIYMPYVETEADIEITYPNPMVGWTVQVYDTGIRYRWDGQEWTPIDALGGNIPNAQEQLDGLMSKEDFVKLRDMTEHVDTRVAVFIIPQEVLAGIQDPHIVFPFDGEILEITASTSKIGTTNTNIRLEKSTDYVDWDTIVDIPIRIESGDFFDNGLHNLLDDEVLAGDIFRLYIPSTGDISNLTVNMKIKL